MNAGTLLDRLVRGTRWVWVSEDYRAALPPAVDESVMDHGAIDRQHSKQGRSTARLRFDSAWGPLSVYVKRHERHSWLARLGALAYPRGRFTPASAEFAHLETARGLGIVVPDTVAAGESIGPWGRLRSFLIVAELTDRSALNECLPEVRARLAPAAFESWKRAMIAAMVESVARLHASALFHKDLYLCHFFVDPAPRDHTDRGLALIDFHRLARHRVGAPYYRWKDLGQLLFSSIGVEGITERDRLRFWMHYRRALGLGTARAERWIIRARAARYLAHQASTHEGPKAGARSARR